MRPIFVTLSVVLVIMMGCSSIPSDGTPITNATPQELSLDDLLITTSELKEKGLDTAEEVKDEKTYILDVLGKDYCQSCFGRKWNAGAGSLGISVMNFRTESDIEITFPKMLDDLQHLKYVHIPLTDLDYVDESFSTDHLPSNATVAYRNDKELYFFVILSQKGLNIVVAETIIYSPDSLDDYKPFIWMITDLANEQWKKVERLQN